MENNNAKDLMKKIEDSVQLLASMAKSVNANVAKITIEEEGGISLGFENKNGDPIDFPPSK